MKNGRILTVILLIALVAATSGCACCFGMDGMFSKLQKSVSVVEFPEKLNIGGKAYGRVYANEYLDKASARTGLKDFAGKLGYGGYGSLVDKGIDLAGIKQYKSFKYSDGTANGTVGGLVAKTDAPSTAAGGYQTVKQSAMAGQWAINDPNQNTGRVQKVVTGGSSTLGDGGDRYTLTVDGQPCYAIVIRYSNLYIGAYSFESYDACEAAIRMAIEQVDAAAA